MHYLKIFAICLCFPFLLEAQDSAAPAKRFELGLNGATLVGGHMGGASDRLTEAVYLKYKPSNFWLRGSFQRHATIALGWAD